MMIARASESGLVREVYCPENGSKKNPKSLKIGLQIYKINCNFERGRCTPKPRLVVHNLFECLKNVAFHISSNHWELVKKNSGKWNFFIFHEFSLKFQIFQSL